MKIGIGIVEKLIKKGYSKYRVAKVVGVSWATVRLWERGVFVPSPEHLTALQNLLKGGDSNA